MAVWLCTSRVIHLTRLPPAPGQPGSSDPTLWAEALSRLKECASAYFDAAVGAQEDDVRRLEINRGVPGWNYCGYFASKVTKLQSAGSNLRRAGG